MWMSYRERFAMQSFDQADTLTCTVESYIVPGATISGADRADLAVTYRAIVTACTYDQKFVPLGAAAAVHHPGGVRHVSMPRGDMHIQAHPAGQTWTHHDLRY